MKRIFDIVFSLIGLIVFSPLLLPIMLSIWLRDFHSPFYVAQRVGRKGKLFRMVKLRSMVIGADRSGVDSTAADDRRIIGVGRFVRRYKLDEIPQLWNVLVGQMSLVGPRPNVVRDVALYTEKEQHLLDVRPGITDIASIVFSDEGEILAGSSDPDLKYSQVIRPWKIRLGLLYISHSSLILDVKIIVLTALAIFSRPRALSGVHGLLNKLEADEQLKVVAQRKTPLQACPPPGPDRIIEVRPSGNAGL